jgi:hypothetical protein
MTMTAKMTMPWNELVSAVDALHSLAAPGPLAWTERTVPIQLVRESMRGETSRLRSRWRELAAIRRARSRQHWPKKQPSSVRMSAAGLLHTEYMQWTD